ncbi:MAG: hypothetical protein LBT26_02110 [Clostridiales Family XIII bacterium]|jgi:hypothetical protein|nr:hypothetical protein [Clostridiales Family XIII bacterium]
MGITISEDDKNVFETILEKLSVPVEKDHANEAKEILNADVKTLDDSKRVLLALSIFETKAISDPKLRNTALYCLAALFKGKLRMAENEAAALLDAYAANLWDCEFIGTKAFVNQIIKQFPDGGSADFAAALKHFLEETEKLLKPGEERTMPMKHYLEDLKQKIDAGMKIGNL